jgi:hypothetical protein
MFHAMKLCKTLICWDTGHVDEKRYAASNKRVWLSASIRLALLSGAMYATQYWQTSDVVVLLSCEPRMGKEKLLCKYENSDFLRDCFHSFLVTMPEKSFLKHLVPSVISKKLDPKTFHPFPRLPAEIRIRIWKFAIIFDPEVNQTSRDVTISRLKDKFRVTLSRRYPALLQVSRESRYEVSKILKGEWLPLDGGSTTTQTNQVQVYVGVDKDSILLRGCTDLFEVKEKGLTWNGRKVIVWNYGRNLKSSDPMYAVLSQ